MIDKKFILVVFLYFIFFLCGCDHETPNETRTSHPLIPVALSFDVFNHTQGFIKSFDKNVHNDDEVTVSIVDLGVEGVDDDRIVIRKDRFGELVAFSQAGEVTFKAPDENTHYTIYLINASNGSDYRKVDTWVEANEGVLEYSPHMRWYREDRNGYEGPEDVIQDAFDQLSDALSYPWGKYGSFQRVDHRREGHFGVGFGYCRDQFGWHSPYWAGVNPDHCSTYKARVSTFLEEVFELITRLDDINGEDTASLITDKHTGKLNGTGKDLLAYVFIKDEKTQ